MNETNSSTDNINKSVKIGAYKVRAVLRQVISFKYSLDNISFYLPRFEYYRMSPELRDLRRQCHEKPGTELGRIFVNMIREGHFKLFGTNPFEPALDETDQVSENIKAKMAKERDARIQEAEADAAK